MLSGAPLLLCFTVLLRPLGPTHAARSHPPHVSRDSNNGAQSADASSKMSHIGNGSQIAGGGNVISIPNALHFPSRTKAGRDISKMTLTEQTEISQTTGNTFEPHLPAKGTIAPDSAPLKCLPTENEPTNYCQFYTTAYQYNVAIKKYFEFLDNQKHVLQVLTSNHLQSPPGFEDSLNRLETSRDEANYQDLVQVLRDRDYRLPESLHPLHYTLSLKIYHWGNATFEGNVVIQVRAEEDTDHIILHCFQLELLWDTISVTPSSSTGPPLEVVSAREVAEAEMVVLVVRSPLRRGEEYNVSLSFQGPLADDEYGIYRLPYEEEGEIRWLALTQFQTVFARRVFPCLDEPRFKARFAVRVARPTNSTALANTPLKTTTPLPRHPDWVWDEFETTPPISTYILALAVVDFDHLSVSGLGITISVWTRPTHLRFASYVLEVVPMLLFFFQDYFGVPYPLSKLDVLALPSAYPRAMENLGLISMHEHAVFRSPSSSLANLTMTCKIAAHELAHMWFGNLVTPAWWDHVWLSEGFASYFAYLGTQSVLVKSYMEDSFVSHEQWIALTTDIPPYTRPVLNPVLHNQTLLVFDDISYNKGATLVRMLSHALTEGTFKKGISAFLKEKEFSVATNDDLIQTLDQVGHAERTLPEHVNLSTAMDTWFNNEGFPLITFQRSSNGSMRVFQRPFHYNLPNQEHSKALFWVPVSLTTETNPDFSDSSPLFWLPPIPDALAVSPTPPPTSWVIANVRWTGLYRVNYDSENWSLLAQQLHQNHSAIPPINRAQILGDAFHLHCAGLLEESVFESLYSYVVREMNGYVWKMLFADANMQPSPGKLPEDFTRYRDKLSKLLDG